MVHNISHVHADASDYCEALRREGIAVTDRHYDHFVQIARRAAQRQDIVSSAPVDLARVRSLCPVILRTYFDVEHVRTLLAEYRAQPPPGFEPSSPVMHGALRECELWDYYRASVRDRDVIASAATKEPSLELLLCEAYLVDSGYLNEYYLLWLLPDRGPNREFKRRVVEVTAHQR